MTAARSLNPMLLALKKARLAAEQGEVPVGAVIWDPKAEGVVAAAHNQPIATHDVTAHAEVQAIREAGQVLGNYRLTDLHLYVTLEPCAMCAGAISLARIGKLIFAAADEKGGAVVNGPRFFEQPTCHWRPEVKQDQGAATESAELLRGFFKQRRAKA